MRNICFTSILLLAAGNPRTQAQWMNVGEGTNEMVSKMLVHDGDLYVAGSFVQAGPILTNDLAKWNGETWSAVNSPSMVAGDALGLVEFNGQLLAYGAGLIDGTVSTIVYDGTDWSSMGSNGMGMVNDAAVFNGELYAGGFQWMKWNGSAWSTLGGGTVYALEVFQGDLYVAGGFTQMNGLPRNNILRWDGNSTFPVGLGVLNGSVLCMEVYNNELYVGGTFEESEGNPASSLMKWTGSTWETAGAGINGQVWTLDSLDGKLHVGGSFPVAGGQAVGNMAVWDGTEWSSLGTGLNARVQGFALYQNDLYACGIFNTAGGTLALNIARYHKEVGITESGPALDELLIHPQPSDGRFTLDGLEEEATGCTITVRDATGRIMIRSKIAQGGQVDLRAAYLANGMYVTEVTKNGHALGRSRLILRNGTD